jgi:polysaccharide deacetylase family protein (PEP-CTERM system associated)
MDVEDWYHLDYFVRSECDCTRTMLDGLGVYRDILNEHRIKSSFFVLGELMKGSVGRQMSELAVEGHEVSSHGWNHVRPLTMSVEAFKRDSERSKAEIEDVLGAPVIGYRAPCFSLDRHRLEVLRDQGYEFDSSFIKTADHPLYGQIDLDGFNEIRPHVFSMDSFVEFEVSTLEIFGKHVPVSGGGYLRIFPWPLMSSLLDRYLKSHQFYTLYIHPFELSQQGIPPLPESVKWKTRKRFQTGLGSVASKIERLIQKLKREGYEFTTFGHLRRLLIEGAEALGK